MFLVLNVCVFVLLNRGVCKLFYFNCTYFLILMIFFNVNMCNKISVIYPEKLTLTVNFGQRVFEMWPMALPLQKFEIYRGLLVGIA